MVQQLQFSVLTMESPAAGTGTGRVSGDRVRESQHTLCFVEYRVVLELMRSGNLVQSGLVLRSEIIHGITGTLTEYREPIRRLVIYGTPLRIELLEIGGLVVL